MTKKISRCLISVSDKTGLDKLLKEIKKYDIEIISTGGTYEFIKSKKYDCIEISEFTSFPEILDGRVKTLHPNIHGGILNIRDNKSFVSNYFKSCSFPLYFILHGHLGYTTSI